MDTPNHHKINVAMYTCTTFSLSQFFLKDKCYQFQYHAMWTYLNAMTNHMHALKLFTALFLLLSYFLYCRKLYWPIYSKIKMVINLVTLHAHLILEIIKQQTLYTSCRSKGSTISDVSVHYCTAISTIRPAWAYFALSSNSFFFLPILLNILLII